VKAKYIADTVAVILWLEKRKMPKKVKYLFENAEIGQIKIYIPSIVFAEIAYLSERKRIEINLRIVKDYLQRNGDIAELPLTFEMVENAFKISDIPELHDRLISAAAMDPDAVIITNDPEIRKSKFVKAIWD